MALTMPLYCVVTPPRVDNEAAMDKSTIFIGSNDYFVPQYDVFPCVHRGVVLALFYLSRDRRALTSARYPMFPHQEKVITWDEFGLTVQGEEVRDP